MALSSIFIQMHFVSLPDAGLPHSASSSKDNSIVDSFENPALSNSYRCDRISGWWDIGWFHQAKAGLDQFFKGNGKMRLLIGVPINSSLKALEKAEREKEYAMTFLQKLEETPELSDWETFDILQTLLKSELVEIRILVMGLKKGNPKPEHAKIQIYIDEEDNKVGACGSKNDTYQGSTGGVDFMIISKSWDGHATSSQIDALQEYFESHWNLDDTASLSKAINDPDFQERLSLLANRNSLDVSDITKISRQINTVSKDLIMVSLGEPEAYPEHISKLYSERIDSLIFRGDETLYQYFIKKLIENKPESKVVIFSEKNIGVKSIFNEEDVEFLEFYNDDNKWSLNSKLEESPREIEVGEFSEKICKFFDINTSTPEIPPTSPRNPTHELVPDIITNYPYGEQLRPHYIRALMGPKYSESDGTIGFGIEKDIPQGFLHEKRALFEHATGSGKTGLGIIAAAHMLEEVDLVIVSCPKRAIAMQWWEECSEWLESSKNNNVFWSHSFLGTPSKWSIEKANLYKKSEIRVEDWYERISLGLEKSILITVNNTLFEKGVRELDFFKGEYKYGLIIDEAHHLVIENETKLDKLSNLEPSWFLALTATFINRKNHSGSKDILDWISDPNNIDVFTLSSALKSGYLKDYSVTYHFIPADDKNQFRENCEKYVIENCSELTSSGPTILYAKAQQVEELNHIKQRLHAEGHHPDTFVFNNQNPQILSDWSSGAINPLIALRILDEGISVDTCSSIILIDSSEEDDRQWIQRRGRALRKDKTNNLAIIHDFVPCSNEEDAEISDFAKKWLKNNFFRIKEFIKDSKDDNEGVFKLISLLDKYSGQ